MKSKMSHLLLSFKTMNLIPSTLLAAVLLVPTGGLAAESGGGRVGSGNDGLLTEDTVCTHCPSRPTPSRKIPTYSELDDLYGQGAAPAPAQLVGNWDLVLKVYNPELKGAGPDVENQLGIKNLDGTMKVLTFSQSKFAPWTQRRSVDVEFKNQGSFGTNQGPYEVAFRDGAACFSQYGFSGGKVDRETYFIYSCRIVYNSAERSVMLCAVEYQDSTQDPDRQKVRYHGYVHYY